MDALRKTYSSGTSDVGTAVGAAETISDGAAVTCEITDERMLK